MAVVDTLADYRRCEKCGGKDLYYGGVGGWRNTIMCNTCFHVRRGVSFEHAIVPLVADQYGIDDTTARRRLEHAQALYEEALARESRSVKE